MPIFSTEMTLSVKYWYCSILIKTNENKLVKGKDIKFNPATLNIDPDYYIGRVDMDNICLKILFKVNPRNINCITKSIIYVNIENKVKIIESKIANSNNCKKAKIPPIKSVNFT